MLGHLDQQEKKTKEHLIHLALKRNSSLDRKISEPAWGVVLIIVNFFFLWGREQILNYLLH